MQVEEPALVTLSSPGFLQAPIGRLCKQAGRKGKGPGAGGGRAAGATRQTRALFVAPILLRESPKRKLVVPSPSHSHPPSDR